MTVEEAREVLNNLDSYLTPEATFAALRRAAEGVSDPEVCADWNSAASRIELALSTIRASEEDR